MRNDFVRRLAAVLVVGLVRLVAPRLALRPAAPGRPEAGPGDSGSGRLYSRTRLGRPNRPPFAISGQNAVGVRGGGTGRRGPITRGPSPSERMSRPGRPSAGPGPIRADCP